MRIEHPMIPVRPSLWKMTRIPIAALFIGFIVLRVHYRIEHNRDALLRAQQSAYLCGNINERFFGEQEPFAPTDPAERRRFILANSIRGFVISVEQFNQEIQTALKDAQRLKLEPSELADIAHAAGDLPLAEKAAREALGGANQNRPLPHVILGDILYASKKYPEAETEYRKAVELTVGNRRDLSFNPIQRLARLYADEQTATPTLDASGNEIPRQTRIISRKQYSLGYWQEVVTAHENSPIAQESERIRAKIPLANACIHFAHILRECGRNDEAKAQYIRAFKIYRSPEGGVPGETQKIRKYIESLTAGDGKEGER